MLQVVDSLSSGSECKQSCDWLSPGTVSLLVLVVPSHPLGVVASWCLVVGFPCNQLKVKLLAGDLKTDSPVECSAEVVSCV